MTTLTPEQRELREASVAEGMRMARRIFQQRGNHSEAHLSEEFLATTLSIAFEHGAQALNKSAAEMMRSLEDLVEDARLTRECVRFDGCDICKAQAVILRAKGFL